MSFLHFTIFIALVNIAPYVATAKFVNIAPFTMTAIYALDPHVGRHAVTRVPRLRFRRSLLELQTK